MKYINLPFKARLILHPTPPFHFDATLHKPSHFPSSDNLWEKGKYWITMRWRSERLGLKLENKGAITKPKVAITVFSRKRLSQNFLDSLNPELIWRFNFDSDLKKFSRLYKRDKILGSVIKKYNGMRPAACNSLYETLVIYIVLQNAIVRRSVQMLENLFSALGSRVKFDGKILSCFWLPEEMARISEADLRKLKVGYRAKFLKRISGQFAQKEIDEFSLRRLSNEEIKKEILKLYGIGPASVEYLLFEDFYRYDALSVIPPWEQKIFSRLLFKKPLMPVKKIIKFFERYGKYKKLASHYLWEDIFWQLKEKKIPWLEKEIRL